MGNRPQKESWVLNLQHYECQFMLVKKTHRGQYNQLAKLIKRFKKFNIPMCGIGMDSDYIWLDMSDDGYVGRPNNKQDNEYEMLVQFVYEIDGLVHCQCLSQSAGIPSRDVWSEDPPPPYVEGTYSKDWSWI